MSGDKTRSGGGCGAGRPEQRPEAGGRWHARRRATRQSPPAPHTLLTCSIQPVGIKGLVSGVRQGKGHQGVCIRKVLQLGGAAPRGPRALSLCTDSASTGQAGAGQGKRLALTRCPTLPLPARPRSGLREDKHCDGKRNVLRQSPSLPHYSTSINYFVDSFQVGGDWGRGGAARPNH
ncbi:hypothetical protein Pmani_034344 [Petrolisthes manimaculis]|uniref:Uncharacterized protein n=1 Tax=Petrolisthes manimaculis TaxID=1843537 RepID=A0AAE1TPH9_9EUCA|nr:hypothetical protein Pmani_034344 [Petrolisthes manimaculis]